MPLASLPIRHISFDFRRRFDADAIALMHYFRFSFFAHFAFIDYIYFEDWFAISPYFITDFHGYAI